MSSRLTNRGLLRAMLMAFALLLAYRFLTAVATSVLMLGVGMLLAVALSWPVEALHRRKVPRSVASVSIALGVMAVLVAGGYLLFDDLAEQVSQLAFSLPNALYQLGERLEQLAARAGLSFESGNAPSLSTLATWGQRVLGGGLTLFVDLASAALGLFVVAFVTVYLSARPGPVLEWTLKSLPPEHRPRVREVLRKTHSSLLNYLKGRILSMFIIGALSTGALYLIGIPGALLLGVLTGLLEFVPFIGPIVAAVPPMLLGLATDPLDALWVALAYLVIQQAEGSLITPLVMRKTVSLHPAVVIAAVTVLGAAFGILGALLAVPTTVVAKVLVEELWFRRFEEETGTTEEPA